MNGSVLLVDDDAAVRAQVGESLRHSGYGVQCAGDVPAAEALLRQARPDMVLLEGLLPGTPGLTLARRLRADARTRDVSLIVVSERADEPDRVAALESGADDFLAKPFSMRELLARIRAVMRRRAPHHGDEAVQFGGLHLDPAAHRVCADGHEVELWATEFRLLHYFMTRPGRILTRAQLLDDVWGDHVFVEDRTVDAHIRKLRVALSPYGYERLIETVRGLGYRFRPEAATGAHPAGRTFRPEREPAARLVAALAA